MITNLFQLQIVSIKDILPHEEFDQTRAKPLIDRFKKEGYLANPIIVARLNGEKYLQLDGMNRFSAFQMMKIPHILVQIIDYNDQANVELASWIHLFHASKEKAEECRDKMKKISVRQGRIEDIGPRYIRAEGLGRLCTLMTRDYGVHLISTNGNIVEKVERLNQLVSFYKHSIIRDVLPPYPSPKSIDQLFKEHPGTNMMFVFPTFTRHQIIEVVDKGGLFPPGVTRHVIKRRCLNVNIPTSFFISKKSIEEKNRELEKKLLARSFRVYEEQTIYFE